ncbi:MAG: D-alanyl-D-alanine carboxypeptidase family protein, partial [Candidatus Fimimonas sp.]
MKKFTSFCLLVCCLCAYLAVCGVVFTVGNELCFAASKPLPNCICSSAQVVRAAPKQTNGDTSAFSTTAKAAAVVERSTGRVLFEKNSHQSLPMASTTKIVTALTVLNNCQNLQLVMQIPAEACGIEGSSVYLRTGEHLTIIELLYGLMLRSGNDCAVALALAVGGTVPHFAEMMNQTAEKLGCEESHFENPHGLHSDNHYTSASDLAKITCAALSNPVFRQIVSVKSAK